jgi:hypothetical protein
MCIQWRYRTNLYFFSCADTYSILKLCTVTTTQSDLYLATGILIHKVVQIQVRINSQKTLAIEIKQNWGITESCVSFRFFILFPVVHRKSSENWGKKQQMKTKEVKITNNTNRCNDQSQMLIKYHTEFLQISTNEAQENSRRRFIWGESGKWRMRKWAGWCNYCYYGQYLRSAI